MAVAIEKAPGSAPAAPEPKWVTPEEASSFAKYLGKQFVPKGDDKFSKKFFYRVESIIPYTPANASGSTSQRLLRFLVQKYHRNKTRSVNVIDGKGSSEKIDAPMPVEGHEMNGDGLWECKDNTASMLIDARDFKEKYEHDTIED
jgi:hypothetical protein